MQEKTGLISVIVPVYNTEKYLKKCLDSIIYQTYKNLEIILVDDGSTDDSGRICDEYSYKDCRIKVIHKTNGGLSDARNAGIEIMTGSLVTFVDSDDWIDHNMIAYLYSILNEYHADISCASFHKVFEKGVKEKENSVDKKISVYTGTEAIERLMYKRDVDTSAWGKLYRKQDFDHIRYPKGVIFEDLATTYQIFYDKERIVYSYQKLYYYLQRENSIMYQNFDRRRFDRIKIGEEMIDWTKNNEPSLQKAAISRYFTANIQLLREIPLTKEWEGDLIDIADNIKKYRGAVIVNNKVKTIDRVIALSTYLGVRSLKVLGKIYKAVWP